MKTSRTSCFVFVCAAAVLAAPALAATYRVETDKPDSTCPPCAVYAAYNEIKVADKAIVHGIGMTHDCFGRFYDELGRWATQR